MSFASAAASAAASTLATLATTLTTDLATAASTATADTSPTPSATTIPAGHGDGHHGTHGDRHSNDSRRSVVIGVVSFLLPFTTAVVFLRIYTRRYLSRRADAVGADDWTMLAALVLAVVDGITMLLMTTQGFGRHMWTLTADQITTYNMYFYLSIVFYYACLGTVKTAILLQYLRVFAVKMRKITLVVLVLIGLWSTALFLAGVFACQPIRAFWDKSVPNHHCISDLPQWYINAAGNIATDILIFALPIPVLWRLNLPQSQRLSLIAVFGLGFFTCAISVIRISFLNLNGDDTYTNVAAACWSISELCCAIVCSSLPTLRPILFHLLPGPLRHHYGSNNNNNNNNYYHNHNHNHNHNQTAHGNSPNMYRTSTRHRQSAYLNAYANSLGGFTGLGHDLDHTFGRDGYRLKSVSTRDDDATRATIDTDADTNPDGMVRRTSRTMIIPPRPHRPVSSYYYNLFNHQHPSAAQQATTQAVPAAESPAATASDKIGLSFTRTTSHLRSTSSLGDSSNSDSDSGFHGPGGHGRGRSVNRDRDRDRDRNHNRNRNTLRMARNRRPRTASSGSDMESDSDLDRYMQWAGRDYYQSQHYRYRHDNSDANDNDSGNRVGGDQEKKAAASPPPAAVTTTTASPSSLATHQSLLTTTPSHRGANTRNSSSRAETLGQAAQALRRNGNGTKPTVDAHRRTKSGATFFLSDDEDGDDHNASHSSNGGGGSNRSRAESKKGPSAPSSAAPTRAQSPAASLPPPCRLAPTATATCAAWPLRSPTVSAQPPTRELASPARLGASEPAARRAEAAVPAVRETTNRRPPRWPRPPLHPPMPSLNPADPLAIDRDAYLGLRQGTVTSIEANRPSTAEAEALGLTLPTGPGIQIRREVAQDVEPA
ncbi:hypothetical protein SPBR_02351 [Sporothrix brasiliensis 5110]|uniref:Rhodopsin domain-containing protein n=1 Tax=Sporothrix brasiliensis 5110 TaxID=1398154 RepID=A0A0C2IZY9_9PEZI|nr:uncharacterized protein SPBR_02351 [Sporothrix brasiliensis 5110]KIH92320.1 hypothetical protein SPBR_02351 [Sporothrix brasiliensis 5110]